MKVQMYATTDTKPNVRKDGQGVTVTTATTSIGTGMDIKVHDQVKFEGDRLWWTVQARNERFVVLTRYTPFNADGTLTYTIMDTQSGRRGPCNLIGQGWHFDAKSPEPDAEDLLAALVEGIEGPKRRQREYEESGVTSWPVENLELEISSRNNVRTVISDRRRA